MAIVEILAFAVFIFLGALATRNLGPLWRHETTGFDRMPAWLVRGLPIGVFAGWAMVTAAIVGTVGMSQDAVASDILLVATTVLSWSSSSPRAYGCPSWSSVSQHS